MTLKETLVKEVGYRTMGLPKYKGVSPTTVVDLQEKKEKVRVTLPLYFKELTSSISAKLIEEGYDVTAYETDNEVCIDGVTSDVEEPTSEMSKEEVLQGNGKTEFMKKQDAQNKQNSEKYSPWVKEFKSQGMNGPDQSFDKGTWEEYMDAVEGASVKESTETSRKNFYSGIRAADSKDKRKLKLGADDKHLRSIALTVAFEKQLEDKHMFDLENLDDKELLKRIQDKYPVGKKEAEYILKVAQTAAYRPQQKKGVKVFKSEK